MTKNKKILIPAISVLLIVIITLVIGLTTSKNIEIGFAENNTSNCFKASFMYFDGLKSKTISFHKDKDVEVTCNVNCKEGDIQIVMTDLTGKKIIDSKKDTETYSFTAENSSNYTVKIIAKKAKGSYNFSWSEK